MNKNEYINDEHVNNFIHWIEPKLNNNFRHEYQNSSNKRLWICNSIYDACINYNWKEVSFKETTDILSSLKDDLNQSILNGNNKEVQLACLKVLHWGGVLSTTNWDHIINNNQLILSLETAKKILNPNSFNLKSPSIQIILNSGFTKIYSLIIDDFIIYDSRVSAALCHLIKLYLIENRENKIPDSLNFRFEEGRKGESRNPNSKTLPFKFSKIRRYKQVEKKRINDYTDFQINNIKASWILKEILERTESSFDEIEASNRLRSLEAALFMIGYSI